MKFTIDEKLANAVLNYLANRPYLEVANLIQGLQTMTPYDDGAKREGISTSIPKESLVTPPTDATPFVRTVK